MTNKESVTIDELTSEFKDIQDKKSEYEEKVESFTGISNEYQKLEEELTKANELAYEIEQRLIAMLPEDKVDHEREEEIKKQLMELMEKDNISSYDGVIRKTKAINEINIEKLIEMTDDKKAVDKITNPVSIKQVDAVKLLVEKGFKKSVVKQVIEKVGEKTTGIEVV